MLGRKNYTQEEFDQAKRTIDEQLRAYKKLAKTVNGAPSDAAATVALEDFEPLFFNNLTLAQSVLKLQPGEQIRITREEFERLSKAFFADLKAKFL